MAPERPNRRAPGTVKPGRSFRLRTVPGRIRALTVAAILAVAALFAVTAVFVGNAKDGLQVIGHGAGPQVVATSRLYFDLSDMDAQIAGILLVGKQTGVGIDRQQALTIYKQRLADANDAVLQAADLAHGDPAGQRTVQAVLNGLGQYEQLVGQALVLDQNQGHQAGQASESVLAPYRQANTLMKLDLLPQAYNLTLDSGTKVRRAYEDKRSAVLAGRLWVLVTGLVVLAVLVGLQVYLAAGFRRLLSPWLVLATAGTLALVVLCMIVFTGEADHLKKAKSDGFDSILALSRARAISNSLNGDETRYLLDPAQDDTYEQVYLDKAQSIVYIDKGTSLPAYFANLAPAIQGYVARAGTVEFLGFYGDEAKHMTLTGQGPAFTTVLTDYGAFQQSDQQVRKLAAAGQRDDAIRKRFGPGGSQDAFNDYDKALNDLIALHTKAFKGAIDDGDGAVDGWSWGLPVATVILAALVVAGVRPRLSEFR